VKLRPIVCLIVLFIFSFVGTANSTDFTFDSDGVDIFYSVEGEGEPVVLIHGAGATGAINWRVPKIVQMLSQKYRVITMDVRGHGKSDKPDNGAVGAAAAEDVRRLLDHLDLENAHIVGYSMGSMITLKLMTEYPERVRSAVIGGMGWYEQMPDQKMDAKKFGELGTTAKQMKKISTPLVVIIGKDDLRQLQRVDRWKSVVPDLDVVIVERANHTNCMFKPAFKEALFSFLDEQSEMRN